jgi:hypothetical protein
MRPAAPQAPLRLHLGVRAEHPAAGGVAHLRRLRQAVPDGVVHRRWRGPQERPLAVATSSPPLTWALATGSPGVERPLAAGPRRRRPSTPGRRWGGRSARPGLRALGRAHLGLVPGLNGPSSHCAVAPWDGHGPRRPRGRRGPRARGRARPAGSALGRCAPSARLDARSSPCRIPEDRRPGGCTYVQYSRRTAGLCRRHLYCTAVV